jgi:O-6-methylguanine DNA methyltransferase
MKERQAAPNAFPISTSEGVFHAHYSSRGLCALDFPQPQSRRRAAGRVPEQFRNWHERTTQALNNVLRGKRPGDLPPLDLTAGSPFQRRVWEQLLGIAPGETRSYGEIAEALGKRGASRAVGGACGANPVPVLVPCHRVLAANKKIGGFSGGKHWKRRLLELEGAGVAA